MILNRHNMIIRYSLTILLCVSCSVSAAEFLGPAAPDNDRCARALPVGEVMNLAFDTKNATADGPGSPIRSPNIWYCYTASCTGLATVSLCGSTYDTMLAVYRGCACDPGRSDLIAYNDDYCGLQSQISFDAVIGRQYLIEVGGYDLFAGRGVLTIVCEGEGEVLFDLGDAPDGTAGPGIAMSAYKPDGRERVQAHYPTSIRPGEGPIGPVHKDPLAVAFLGQNVSLELNAEDGPDMDLLNNIDPVNDAADQDLSDDGVILPIEMPQCQWTTFDYLVNILEPGTPVWINVWFDWNRDGDWDDDSETDVTIGCDGRRVSEWAVRNQYLFGLPEGIHRLTSPAFVSWHPDTGPEDIWMRITLSEQPWRGGEHPKLRGNGGSGPADGYEIGETEDYVFVPSLTGQSDEPCSLCRDVNGDGRVDWEDMAALTNAWLESCQ